MYFYALQSCGQRDTLDHATEAGDRERRASHGDKYERRLGGLPLKTPQGAKLIAADGVGGRRAVLDPANEQRPVLKIDLIPAQVHQFGGTEAVPIRQQDHGGIAVAFPGALGRCDQTLDLGAGQMLTGPQLLVRPASWNCALFSFWR